MCLLNKSFRSTQQSKLMIRGTAQGSLNNVEERFFRWIRAWVDVDKIAWSSAPEYI